MIRFCDREVSCISYNELSRNALRSYFLKGNINDIVCVFDEFNKYKGMITWHSLLAHTEIDEAINTQYITLDHNIWKAGRKLFRFYESDNQAMIPVLNKEHQLVCFAYQDEEANRELRMIEELEECEDAEGFKDVYSEYDCVTIYGCNELAYYFAKYLEGRGIKVNVTGEIWKELGEWNWKESLDYQNYPVYAEGRWEKSKDPKRNFLRSVSAEFECIDCIYEANIKKGIIRNQEMDFSALMEKLRREKQVIIVGTDYEAQNTYDLLLANHVDVCCFASTGEKQRQKLFGKPMKNKKEIFTAFPNPVFIEGKEVGSAWGFGGVDEYHYDGYKRNKQYFLLKDYVEIPHHNLENILKDKNIVLVGDVYLCNRVYRYFQNKDWEGNTKYWNILEERIPDSLIMNQIGRKEIREDDICLLIFPQIFIGKPRSDIISNKKKKYIKKLEEYKIDNYTDFFSGCQALIDMEEGEEQSIKLDLHPKSIIMGTINDHSGTIFLKDLLDWHPNILLIDNNFLGYNLYTICMRLAEERASGILPLFWKLYEAEAGMESLNEDFPQKERFNDRFQELLKSGTKFTSQELFIMIHIAYSYMWGKKDCDIKEMIIYWEPHQRWETEEFSRWLGRAKLNGYTMNMVRNSCVKSGSRLVEYERYSSVIRNEYGTAFDEALFYPQERRQVCKAWDMLTIKFEDLKCKPREILAGICEKMKIPWSETLMETTRHGAVSAFRGVTGFDLKPVYNDYERYLSAYDRMRIALFTSPWQRKYGYPYISCMDYSRVELQEMFLKKFRFEDNLVEFVDEENRLDYYLVLQKRIRKHLWKLRWMEMTGNNNLILFS